MWVNLALASASNFSKNVTGQEKLQTVIIHTNTLLPSQIPVQNKTNTTALPEENASNKPMNSKCESKHKSRANLLGQNCSHEHTSKLHTVVASASCWTEISST